MNFSDLLFLYAFLPLCLIAYFITKNKGFRNIVLLVFSLAFYAWGDPGFFPLLICVALFNWLIALGIKRLGEKPAGTLLVFIGVILDIGLLAVFKYTGFAVENINAVAGTAFAVPKLAAPLGVSFYTFRLVSYLLDVKWEKTEPERNFGRFLMYVSLFPSLVAGPIVRYEQVSEQLIERNITFTSVSSGASRVIAGLAKKVIIADSLASAVSAIFGEEIAAASVVACWIGAAVYALQMYFDFSGYSDMAIGLAEIFGITYPENFNYPFMCKTIAEFWQRWHMTLGSFFRDYLLYVPIFGKQRKYMGLFLVWLSTGIWHGAAWNYVIWGLFFGTFILIETLLGKKRIKKIPVAVRHIYTKLVLVVGFGIFRFEDTSDLFAFLRGLVGANGNSFWEETSLHAAANNLFLILVALLFSFPIIPYIREKLHATPGGIIVYNTVNIVCNCLLLIIASIMLVSSTSNPFLYANF